MDQSLSRPVGGRHFLSWEQDVRSPCCQGSKRTQQTGERKLVNKSHEEYGSVPIATRTPLAKRKPLSTTPISSLFPRASRHTTRMMHAPPRGVPSARDFAMGLLLGCGGLPLGLWWSLTPTVPWQYPPASLSTSHEVGGDFHFVSRLSTS